MPEAEARFDLLATGIGSVPHTDVGRACGDIFGLERTIPFWPQMVRRSPLEEMNAQFSEGLPLLDFQDGRVRLAPQSSPEEDLARFYERYLAQDVDRFAISPERAQGLHGFLEQAKSQDRLPTPFVKGQSIGPVTFAATIPDAEGKPILYHPDLFEAVVHGLSIKALWQIRKLSGLGRRVILFLDEPFLASYGSAFTTLEPEQVTGSLSTLLDYLREHSHAMIGVHCCGNTDWSLVLAAGPDILSFDAWGYMEHFLLYSPQILQFLEKGGALAWGIVPTDASLEEADLAGLTRRLEAGFQSLCRLGVDHDTLRRRSLITPSCGMGTLPLPLSRRCLKLLSALSTLLGERWSPLQPPPGEASG